MKKKPGRRRFHTTLNEEILIEAQVRCMREHRALNEVIDALLQRWLDDGKNGGSGEDPSHSKRQAK